MAAGGKRSKGGLLRRLRSDSIQPVLAVVMLVGIFAAAVALPVAAGW